MRASPSPLHGLDTAPGESLPPWLSFVCEDAPTHQSVGHYLGYLGPGLGLLGPAPLRLVIHVVVPGEIPGIGAEGGALASRGRYRVARVGDDLLCALDGRALLRLDRRERSASIWTTTGHAREPEVLTGLLSIVLLELAALRGFLGLHAAAVVRDGACYLLPGPSGSGKTSLSLTFLREGFRYVTDDFVLLTERAGPIQCLPFFRSFNVDVGWAGQFPELSFLRDLPARPNGKRIFDPEQCYPASRAGASRPTCLLFPAIVARSESTVRRVPPREALCRLLPQSRVSLDLPTARTQLRTLGRLAGGVVAFELAHGLDFLRAPAETLRGVLATLGEDPAAPPSP